MFFLNRDSTLNENLIQRLTRRRDREDRAHETNRHGHLSARLWHGLAGVAHESHPEEVRPWR